MIDRKPLFLILGLLIPLTFLNALKPLRRYPAVPSDYGIIYREVTFQTRDSHALKGWFFPAQDTAGIVNQLVGRMVPLPDSLRPPARPYKTLDEEPRPTIVICDGDGGNMTFLIYYAYHFFTKGYNVFTFDWRGFGESSNWPTDSNMLCYPEFLTDYHAAIDCIKAQPEVDTARIGIMGFSTGAYLSFAIAAEREDISAYAGRALMTSFDDILPILKNLNPERGFKAPGNYPDELLPVNAAEDMDVAAFLIVGENDERTPPQMSEEIYEKLAGPKKLWIVPDAGHGGREAPELTNYPEFFNRVSAFFDSYLK